MGAKTEAVAKQVEAKCEEALATVRALSDKDWPLVTSAEKWSVGVTAHHLAGAIGVVTTMIESMAAGHSSLASFGIDKIDEANAIHAREYANCTKAETIDLLQRNASAAVKTLRELDDNALARSAKLFEGGPTLTRKEASV